MPTLKRPRIVSISRDYVVETRPSLAFLILRLHFVFPTRDAYEIFIHPILVWELAFQFLILKKTSISSYEQIKFLSPPKVGQFVGSNPGTVLFILSVRAVFCLSDLISKGCINAWTP